MNMVRKFACWVACLAVAGVAMAASTNEFTVIDIMETMRQSEVESPFTAAFTGELSGSVSMQLFDGDLTADNNKDADKNGRAIFVASKSPSVTVSFNPAAFGNRPVFLRQYGFCMGVVANAAWQVSNRLPAEWTVKVSNKENPTSDDDWTVVDSRSGLTSDSYTLVNNSYYAADFKVESTIAFRHIRFAFTGATTGSNQTYLQLGEILMSGLIAPDESGRRDVCLYETLPVLSNSDGSATAKVSILPAGTEVDPYDLFVAYGTGDRATTNLLEHATQTNGLYETTIPGLRLGADYTLQFGTIATNGTVELGEVVPFSTPLDVVSAGGLPGGFEAVEYIESTDMGRQYIDCGFAPSGRMGFAIDFTGYSSFQKGAYHDTDNRDTGYGVYLSSIVKGQNAQLLISTSTGMNGNYSTGLFWCGGTAYNAKLTRNERMQILFEDTTSSGNYRAICGATTSSQNVTGKALTGPNVFVFADGNGPGNDPDQFGVMRLYSLKFYNDSVSPRELIHDFVPVHKIADDSYGLYDLVAGAWCPNGSTNAFLAGSVVYSGGRLDLSSVSRTGRALSATLTRGWTGAADVYVAWGSAYAGIDAANWEHTERIGAFAENDSSVQVTTPDLGRATIYVRFYTADGKWSETVYLPDYNSSAGFVIFVR